MDRILSHLVLSLTVYLSGKEPGSKTHSVTGKDPVSITRNGTNQISYFQVQLGHCSSSPPTGASGGIGYESLPHGTSQ